VVHAFRERTAATPIVTAVVPIPSAPASSRALSGPGVMSPSASWNAKPSAGVVQQCEGAPDRVAAAAEQAVRALGLVPHMLDVRRTSDLAPALDAARAHGDQS
jgi:hypothetical protein